MLFVQSALPCSYSTIITYYMHPLLTVQHLQAVMDDEDAGAVRVHTIISIPVQDDMNVERPGSPDRREEMSE